MKFGKLLQTTCDGHPELEDLFLRYKQLKKQVKRCVTGDASFFLPPDAGASGVQAAKTVSPSNNGQQPQDTGQGSTSSQLWSLQHVEFMQTLNEDLSRFNEYFMEKEEDAVIRLQMLTDELSQPQTERQLQALKGSLVALHGEMVLLLHWSLLTYAAIIKILKKHDKRTGMFLKPSVQGAVLQQPFSSTSIMQDLVKKAEEMVAILSTGNKLDVSSQQTQAGSPTNLMADSSVFRRTQQALEVWATLSSTAATPSTVLPAELVESMRHGMGLLTTDQQTRQDDEEPSTEECSTKQKGAVIQSHLCNLEASGSAANTPPAPAHNLSNA